MPDTHFPFSAKSADTIRWLLPSTAVRSVVDGAVSPHLLMSDFAHVRQLIGTPRGLEDEISVLGLGVEQPLPPAQETLLANTVMLFALAMEVFDSREQALRWWEAPLALPQDDQLKAPRDWVAIPGATRELAQRIRQTLNGIF